MNHFGNEVPNDTAFRAERDKWRQGLASNMDLRRQALSLHEAADSSRFGYQWDWLGTPIIRWPEDIVLFQEVIFNLRPTSIVETGIARGGSILLSASLMDMCGLEPRVLGIDIAIHDHAMAAVASSRFASSVHLWEGDSASNDARAVVDQFLSSGPTGPTLMVLDSNHTEAHVHAELQGLATLLTTGSVVAVADTIVEFMPEGFYRNRPWGPGNSPLSAVRKFLRAHHEFREAQELSRRGLLTEFRDGFIVRIS